MNSSVVIRTLILRDAKFEFQVGGAITFDSNPEGELAEIFTKAKSIAGAGCHIFLRQIQPCVLNLVQLLNQNCFLTFVQLFNLKCFQNRVQFVNQKFFLNLVQLFSQTCFLKLSQIFIANGIDFK